jgi:hypothetical protein
MHMRSLSPYNRQFCFGPSTRYQRSQAGKKLSFLGVRLLAACSGIGYGWDVVEVIHTV